MTASGVQMYTCDLEGGSFTRHERTVGVGDDGTVYVPAFMAGLNDQAAFYLCAVSGAPFVTVRGRAYVSTGMAIAERPERADDIERVRQFVLSGVHDAAT